MLKKQYVIGVLILLTSSCSLWPTYTKPPIAVPKHWDHGNTIRINDSVDLPDMHWWKQFHQPELNVFIQRALQHNNTLQLAVTNIDYAHSQLDQITLNWYPGLSLLSGYSQMPVFGNPGAFYLAIPQYVLNIFQQVKQEAHAKALLNARVHAEESVRLTIIADVTASFFTLIAEQENMLIQQRMLHYYQNYLSLFQAQYRANLIARDRIVDTESDIERLKSKIDITRHNVVVVKNSLHYLLNENPGYLNVKTSFKDISTHGFVPYTIPMQVLANRPDVQEAEARLKAANENIGATSANLLPSLSLGAYLGQGTNINGAMNLSEATVNLPLVNLPVYTQIKGSKIHYKAALLHYQDTIKRALRDVENSLSAYTAYTQQWHHDVFALKRKQQHCHWVTRRHQHGLTSKKDVLQCQIQLTRLELLLNHNKLSQLLVLVRLYRDLAGGYRGA